MFNFFNSHPHYCEKCNNENNSCARGRTPTDSAPNLRAKPLGTDAGHWGECDRWPAAVSAPPTRAPEACCVEFLRAIRLLLVAPRLTMQGFDRGPGVGQGERGS